MFKWNHFDVIIILFYHELQSKENSLSSFKYSLFCPFRIGDPQAIHPHAYKHAVLDPASRRLPLRPSVAHPHAFRPFHGAESVAAGPPHPFRSAATGPKPDPARHDYSPAHHGYIHHHGNHLVTSHGEPGRAQFHQRRQLCLVKKKKKKTLLFVTSRWLLPELCCAVCVQQSSDADERLQPHAWPQS